jgi:glycine oxidase
MSEKNGVIQNSYDAVVVGGGVLGQSIALELARVAMKILLIYPQNHGRDSATLAAGAMIGAFGELTHNKVGFKDRKKLEFRIRSQEMQPSWLDSLREESGRDIFTTQGMFMIANDGSQEDLFNLKRIKTELDAYGKRSEWVEPTEVPLLQPYDAYQAHQALFIPDDFTIDIADLMAALASNIEANPYSEVLHDRSVSIEADQREDGWIITTAEHGQISAPNVVICAGARVSQALGEVTLPRMRLPLLYFAKGIGCVVSGAPSFPHAIRTPNRSDACGLHVVPRAKECLYIGASNHYGYATAAARGITPGEVTAILGQTIREINRTLRDTTIEELRFGLRPMSLDDLPLIGRTILPGLFFATGTHRTGIVMAPLIAKVVASELLNQEPPVENPFSVNKERCDNGSDLGFDSNLANLYLDRGLKYYYSGKSTKNQSDLEQALNIWREYVRMVGDHSDPQILELMAQLEMPWRTVGGERTLEPTGSIESVAQQD